MFGLLSGFIDWYFAKTEVNILVLGLDNAGKTTFLEQTKLLHRDPASTAVHVPLDSILPTVGLNLGRVQTMGCDVTVWDLGGQQALRSIWDKYFLTRTALCSWLTRRTQTDSTRPHARFACALAFRCRGLPVLVLANKRNLPMRQNPSMRLS